MKMVSGRMTTLNPAIVYIPYYSFDCITIDVKPAVGSTGPWSFCCYSWKTSVFSWCVCLNFLLLLLLFLCGNLCTSWDFYCIFIVMNE